MYKQSEYENGQEDPDAAALLERGSPEVRNLLRRYGHRGVTLVEAEGALETGHWSGFSSFSVILNRKMPFFPCI